MVNKPEQIHLWLMTACAQHHLGIHTYRHKWTPKNPEEREFRMLGEGDGEGKVGDVCGPTWGPCVNPFWPDWGPVQGSWWDARLEMAS